MAASQPKEINEQSTSLPAHTSIWPELPKPEETEVERTPPLFAIDHRDTIKTFFTKFFTVLKKARYVRVHIYLLHGSIIECKVPETKATTECDPVQPSAPALSSMPESSGTRHRYFRIECSGDTEGRSWWFAHFDGQFVVRQMTLYHDKMPVLLQAGHAGNSMLMCQLSLQETGLEHASGAEIHECEFEQLWTQYSGPARHPAQFE